MNFFSKIAHYQNLTKTGLEKNPEILLNLRRDDQEELFTANGYSCRRFSVTINPE